MDKERSVSFSSGGNLVPATVSLLLWPSRSHWDTFPRTSWSNSQALGLQQSTWRVEDFVRNGQSGCYCPLAHLERDMLAVMVHRSMDTAPETAAGRGGPGEEWGRSSKPLHFLYLDLLLLQLHAQVCETVCPSVGKTHPPVESTAPDSS